MRTITKTYDIYTYDELSKQAKERVKRDFLNTDYLNSVFAEDTETDLELDFPNSNLKRQYRLSSCQGDGFNIYGSISFKDLENNRRDATPDNEFYPLTVFTDKEWKKLREYSGDFRIIVPENRRYGYCMCDRIDFANEALSYLGEKADKDLVYKFEHVVKRVVGEYCRKKEQEGYDFLYNISDEEMSDISDCNGWEYTEFGDIWFD